MYVVYILYSEKHDKYYIGQTANLPRRLKEHNSGQSKSTAPFRPYSCRWVTSKPSRQEAEILEKKLKNFKSKKRIQEFILKYASLDIEKLLNGAEDKSAEAD